MALAGSETQSIPKYLSIPVEVGPALKSQSILNDRWACSVSSAIAGDIGLGAQIRVCRNDSSCAIYTVTEVRKNDAQDMIRLGKVARQRLGTTSTGFSATLRQALATEAMSDDQAKNASEFVERIEDSGGHQGLLVMAPHGGAIELNTDRQARRVAQKLSGADVSTWCCKGYKSGGGAWDRWHVTSTAIHPKSFPGLASVSQRDFAYAVAFHGMSAAGVLIGGGGSHQLKKLLQQEIKAAIGGQVTIAGQGNSLGGSSPNNVVNWVTAGGAGGIQIEQSYEIRSKHWQAVADAVAKVYAGLV
ncbi:MAG TPA: poly-gamma-glutamate hydrolase family protein [Enhygromyxa sp.]|nr:poly-gamma-glutamate hydrolase family protein [Enhygromyxa sp.]